MLPKRFFLHTAQAPELEMRYGDGAFVSLFLLVWLPRWFLGSTGSEQDAYFCLLISFVWCLCAVPHAILYIILPLSVLWIGISHRVLRPRNLPTKESKNEVDNKDFGPLKPLILPCRTAHTRLFPEHHGFSYSYLQVGVPVGWRGSLASMIATDLSSQPHGRHQIWRGLFKVEAADHLDRGNISSGLRGKLDAYLEAQVCLKAIPVYYER